MSHESKLPMRNHYKWEKNSQEHQSVLRDVEGVYAEVGNNKAANFCQRANISMYSNPDLANRSMTRQYTDRLKRFWNWEQRRAEACLSWTARAEGLRICSPPLILPDSSISETPDEGAGIPPSLLQSTTAPVLTASKKVCFLLELFSHVSLTFTHGSARNFPISSPISFL